MVLPICDEEDAEPWILYYGSGLTLVLSMDSVDVNICLHYILPLDNLANRIFLIRHCCGYSQSLLYCKWGGRAWTEPGLTERKYLSDSYFWQHA